MRLGLMRSSHVLHVDGVRAQQRRPQLATLLLAACCLAVGFHWGVHSRNPYPYEQGAFLPPPKQQEQQRGASKLGSSEQGATRLDAAITPPTLGILPAEAGAAGAGDLSMDEFADAFVKQSQLLEVRPPVRHGKSGDASYTVVPHQVLSWYPRIVYFPRFLNNSQARHIIKLAEPRLQPSRLGVGSVPLGEAGDIRTSEGVFLDSSEDPDGVLAALEEKIAAVTLIPPSHGEDFNVLRYQNGQHYHSHMDVFDATFLRRNDPSFGQRMATMILYLSDVEKGGETVFKSEGRYGAAKGVPHALDTCEDGDFKYQPRAGDALLFYSLNPDLSINPRSLHGACPVHGALPKFVATLWLHDKPIKEWDGEQRQRQKH